jgi:NAD(P)H-dependent FMN reductase
VSTHISKRKGATTKTLTDFLAKTLEEYKIEIFIFIKIANNQICSEDVHQPG